jgi:hypothetical protein
VKIKDAADGRSIYVFELLFERARIGIGDERSIDNAW